MPDPLSPSDDELVSAYLDGEATADEIARVESSPELLAEVETLRAVTTEVDRDPEPGTIDPARRDAHIAAALEASTTSSNVRSLTTRRARPWYHQPIAAVAAVLLAAVIAVPLLANLGSSSDDADLASTGSEDAGDEGSTDLDAAAPAATNNQRSAAADLDDAELAQGDEAADGGAGDDGATVQPEEAGADATAFYARLRPSTARDSFGTVAAVVAAFDELAELDDAEAASTTTVFGSEFAESIPTLPCAGLFTAEVLVAAVDDIGEVLVGTIDGETVVIVAADGSCDRLFPDE